MEPKERYRRWCEILKEFGFTDPPPESMSYVLLPEEYVLTPKDVKHAEKLIRKYNWECTLVGLERVHDSFQSYDA